MIIWNCTHNNCIGKEFGMSTMVKKEVSSETIQDALYYIESHWENVNRVGVTNNIELGVFSTQRALLNVLQQLLGGRVQHRNNGFRWYLRPSCPSYAPFLAALKEKDWERRRKVDETSVGKFESMLGTLVKDT